jgi:hypothetical protein
MLGYLHQAVTHREHESLKPRPNLEFGEQAGRVALRRENFCVIKNIWNGTVPDTFLGAPIKGKRISFRLLHL